MTADSAAWGDNLQAVVVAKKTSDDAVTVLSAVHRSDKWQADAGFMKTGGGLSGGRGYFIVEVPTGYTATITSQFYGNGTGDRSQYLSKTDPSTASGTTWKEEGGYELKVTSTAKTDIKTISYDAEEAGKYYLYADNNVGIYNVKVELTSTSSSASVAAPTVSSVTVTQDAEDSSKVTITVAGIAGDTGSKYVLSRNDKADYKDADGTETSVEFTDTLKASGTYTYTVYGKGSANTASVDGDVAVTYTLPLATPSVTTDPDNGKVTVKWGAVAEATSYDVHVYDGETELTALAQTGLTGTSVAVTGLTNNKEYGFTVTANRGADSATSSKVTATPVLLITEIQGLDANKLKVSTFPTTGDIDLSTYLNAGETLTGSWYVNNVKNKGKGIDDTDKNLLPITISGVRFTKRIDLGGGSKTYDGSIYLKLVLDKDSHIIAYTAHGGGSGVVRYLQIFGLDAEKNQVNLVDTLNVVQYGDSPAASRAVNLPAGTYYLNSQSSGISIYGIYVGEGDAPRAAWDTVADPVINSVTRNADGTVTINFAAEVGNDDGADTAKIFMFKDGFETANADIAAATGSSNEITMTPIVEGDLTFKIIMGRAGEADKESNVAALNGYILPAPKPSITWLNNLGGGSVYVDWNNVDAEKVNLFYKAEGASDYILASENNTEGNYTLTGLSEGTTYAVKTIAYNSVRGNSEDEKTITVGAPVQQWYADVFGSATSAVMTINGTEYKLSSLSATGYGAGTKVADVTNNGGTIEIAKSNNGKVADSEEGIEIYYTKINPNTENFKLTATFEVIDDYYVNNQSAYGIYALDIAGVGTKDAKYMNSVSVGQFKMFGGTYHSNGARLITGYTSYDPTSTAGTGRNLNNTNKFAVQSEDDHSSNGDTFTYTLEKTNTGFICSMAGDETPIIFDGVQNIMVQEDGSIVVGVMAARVGVRISNIQFEKTAGAVEGGVAVEEVEPKLSVFSSNKTASQNYEFIAMPNVPGTLQVRMDGYDSTLRTYKLAAEEAVRVPCTLWEKEGENRIDYRFYPYDIFDNKDLVIANEYFMVEWKTAQMDLADIYVAPDRDGSGTQDDPMDLQRALDVAMPGQTIVMLDGTYYPEKMLKVGRSQSGTSDAMITLTAQHPGSVVIDGSKVYDGSNALFTLVGSYWHVYGIEFCNGAGVRVNGNYNVIELCQFHHNTNSGLQISRNGGEPNMLELWPTGNLVKNCDSYDNCDPGRSDADGFAAKLTVGEGNKFYGCISHHNIDDGWDLYAKSTTGPIGAVIIENCVTYQNGWLSSDDPKSMSKDDFGEGNGFKLGGENMYGAHQVINSISYDNYAKGITSNSGPDCQVHNCTAFNNSLSGSSYNLSLYTKTSNTKAWVVDGMLSVVDKDVATSRGTSGCYPVAELGSSNGVIASLRSASNYLYDGSASLNTKGVKATSAWFVSTDISIVPTRNADGSINMHGLLELTDAAPADTGARLVTTGEDAVSTKPSADVKVEVSETLSSDSLTAAVVAATGATTVEALAAYLEKAIVGASQAEDKATIDDPKNIKVVEVDVMISLDGGATWVKATPANFPKNGVDVTIPYPEGTNKYRYDFVIGHLITQNCNGRVAGTMEYFTPAKDYDGLRIHVMAASPFVIGWVLAPEEDVSQGFVASVSGGSGADYYIVGEGDTWESIAQKFGLTTLQLLALNAPAKADDMLYVGQQLVVANAKNAAGTGAAGAKGKTSPKTDALGTAAWNGFNALLPGLTIPDTNGADQNVSDGQQDVTVPVTAASAVTNKVAAPWVAIIVLMLSMVGVIGVYMVYRRKENEE